MGNTASSDGNNETSNNNSNDLNNSTIISIQELANLQNVSSVENQNVLYWEGINYSVNDKLQGHLDIIKNVSGFSKSGRLLAIMGSSGSGKTTLLDILCGRILSNKRTGNVTFNGKDTSRMRFAYVPQQDLLLNTATVRETLETAARLRIPNLQTNDLNQRIETVLNDLGLKHRENAMVGGGTSFIIIIIIVIIINHYQGEIRSLSGGERRRVSIGQEIVSANNQVLCLDECTTGLDSKTAASIVACLKQLAVQKNLVLVATIHQPNSIITSMFDDLMLLVKGECVFFGEFQYAIKAFSNVGLNCPIYSNPTDFFVDVCDIDGNASKLVKAQTELFSLISKSINNDPKQVLSLEDKDDKNTTTSCFCKQYPTSSMTQVSVLTKRAARQWIRDPGMFVSELIQYTFIALFVGGMYYQIDLTVTAGSYNRIASLFFILAVLIFTPPFTAITTFSLERALLKKERGDRLYRSSSWLFAKTITVAPVEGILCLIFSAICYFMIGYQRTADKFFIYFGILFLFQLNAESLGLLFSIFCGSPIFAIVWLSLVLIVALSLTGFLTFSMPYFYVWIMKCNMYRFALIALIINEMDGLELTMADGTKVNALSTLPPDLVPEHSLGEYVAILIGFWVALRLAILIALQMDSKIEPYTWIFNKLTCSVFKKRDEIVYNSIPKNINS